MTRVLAILALAGFVLTATSVMAPVVAQDAATLASEAATVATEAAPVATEAAATDDVAAAEAAPEAEEEAAAPLPVPDKGDIAWMTVATLLVLLMTIPGLALFYGGLVRAKNMLSVLTQVFAITCIVAVIWIVYGYSLAFTDGGSLNSYVGGLSKMFLAGVDYTSVAATFSNGVYIPEYSFIAFQMTFACITPALIVGAFAERINFGALLVFTVLWVTFIYFPMAHMVWWWGGPDFVAEQATIIATTTDEAAKAAAEAAIAANGMIFNWGALDFAGGTVVHINAGIAGLVGCLVIGKRVGFAKEPMPPHSLVMTMIGGALLWVGWFGFNAGSNLESNAITVLAMLNTFTATAGAAAAWLLAEWAIKGKPSLLGLVTGAVAGLVAVTPASGWGGPVGCMFLGMVAGVVCLFFCTTVKNALGYDDSLDVFGVHCIGGIVGALATGILVNPALGGAGIPDYISEPGSLLVADYVFGTAFMAQVKAVVFTLLFSGIGSFILFKLVDMLIGLRPPQDVEREGLDLASHGERAYTL
jgi:Amt family ammonium transporter